jgi:hypothetical protein
MFNWIRPLFVASLNRGVLPAPTQVHSWPEKEIIIGKRERISIDTRSCNSLETLNLVCRLETFPLVYHDVTGQISVAGVPLDVVGLYSSEVMSAAAKYILLDHVIKGVRFFWLGFMEDGLGYRLETEEGEPLAPQGVLYSHSFFQQTSGHFFVAYKGLGGGGILVTPPGCLNGYSLWRYGGLLGPGGKIHLSEPLYFALLMSKNKTFVDWTPSKLLRQIGITYEKPVSYNDRQYTIQEPGASTETLADSVASGCIQIVVKQDHEPPIHMQSIRIKPETDRLFTVTFKRKKADGAVK